ncbi:hypothetical protein CTAYLR_006453 [Chrysophaeum taylorii]|uniref:SGNH hydrolase-type esterase domain-containing protein n=1 Tax=Chrysophaeum taylorii TaxID=2483200 RepID=A0AAD7ULF0_9STRA|nr:hypothetical protein CTAYLR_006453 [Chrysophaeum taylorii]
MGGEDEEVRLRYDRPLGSSSRPEFCVLAYGDSLTAGYHAGGFRFSPYARSLETSQLLCDHLGLSGWTATQMVMAGSLASTLSGAADGAFRYDLAIIMAGTNDLGSGDGEAIARQVWKLHRSAHELGVRTLGVGVPGSFAQQRLEYVRTCAETFNRSLEGLCANEPLASYVACPVEFSETSRFWEADGLHMSRAGYEALGRALRPHVLATLRS